MSSRHRLILIAALTLGASRIASAQMADSLLIPIAPAVPSVTRDASEARSDLKRDQRAERDLNRVIDLDSHTLVDDEHHLHQVRAAMVRDVTRDRTVSLSDEQDKSDRLEQAVTVLRGSLAAEHELAMENARDVRLDRQQLKLDGRS
ncbi:MAG TPA: hypothetical protein VFU03_08455 [Gemmatimonadales bacterium]|nr:hypothetical protein [Gemmatimonadales bacterium]